MRLLIPPENLTLPMANFGQVQQSKPPVETIQLKSNYHCWEKEKNEEDEPQKTCTPHPIIRENPQFWEDERKEDADNVKNEYNSSDESEEPRAKKYNSNQHRVDKKLEEKVYSWAMGELNRGNRVQMVSICRYARMASKNKGFLGSTGWCSNFLNRYPDLKNLVKNKANKFAFSERNQNNNFLSKKLSGRLDVPSDLFSRIRSLSNEVENNKIRVTDESNRIF